MAVKKKLAAVAGISKSQSNEGMIWFGLLNWMELSRLRIKMRQTCEESGRCVYFEGKTDERV